EFIEFNIEALKKELIGDIYDQDKIQRVSLVYPIHKSKPFSIVIEVLSKNLLVIEGAVGVIINLEGFFAGYAFNSEDNFLQNTDNLAFYKSKGIDTDELKTIRNRYGDLRIDISENPGRRVFIENMWLMSCWRMWFGEMSFKYLDKSKLSTFPKAKEIRFKG